MTFLNGLIIAEFVIFILAIMVTNFDFISPGTCTISIFFFATLLLKFVENTWCIVITGYSFSIIVIGLVMILIAEVLATKTSFKKTIKHNRVPDSLFYISINTSIQKVLIGLSLVFMVVYVLEILAKGVGMGVGGFSSIGAVANSMSNGTERLSTIGKISYQFCSLIPYPFCWIFSKMFTDRKNRKKKWINLIPIVCSIIVQFFGANRHNILRIIFAFAICCYIAVRKESNISKKERKKIISRVIILFCAFFILFYVIRDVVKVSSHNITFVEYFIYYLSSPIVLFSKYLDSPSSVRAISNLWGETCFTGFYATLSRWGLIDDVNALTNHTVIGGVSGIRTGNTYTFFMRPFHDFGVTGVIIITFIVFLVACVSYHKVISKNSWSIKSFCKKMRHTIFMGYFYYMFPIAVTDFYIAIESKVMTIVYLAIISFICSCMIKVKYKEVC